jgi:hypothetical protein
MSTIQEVYSKWELNEDNGIRYRTVSMCVPHYTHVFAVEVLNHGRRKLFLEGSPEFLGVSKIRKSLSGELRKPRTEAIILYEPAQSKAML